MFKDSCNQTRFALFYCDEKCEIGSNFAKKKKEMESYLELDYRSAQRYLSENKIYFYDIAAKKDFVLARKDSNNSHVALM